MFHYMQIYLHKYPFFCDKKFNGCNTVQNLIRRQKEQSTNSTRKPENFQIRKGEDMDHKYEALNDTEHDRITI